MNWIELFGYCGSVLVALSLMMKSIKKLRWINLAGASVFSSYGLLVGAYPVFFLNGFIVLVDIYYLLQMKRQKDYFTSLEINPNSRYMSKFVEFYSEDIKIFFPNFSEEVLENNFNVFILRNLLPVGLISYHQNESDTAVIDLDYAIPDYRDLKNAYFLLSCESVFFKDRGIKKLIAKGDSPEHVGYLKKLDFVLRDKSDNSYLKVLCK